MNLPKKMRAFMVTEEAKTPLDVALGVLAFTHQTAQDIRNSLDGTGGTTRVVLRSRLNQLADKILFAMKIVKGVKDAKAKGTVEDGSV